MGFGVRNVGRSEKKRKMKKMGFWGIWSLVENCESLGENCERSEKEGEIYVVFANSQVLWEDSVGGTFSNRWGIREEFVKLRILCLVGFEDFSCKINIAENFTSTSVHVAEEN